MNKEEILIHKNNLVSSDDYKSIRDYQLHHIVNLSDSCIEPVILKGMLKLIHDTDKWSEDFLREKAKKECK